MRRSKSTAPTTELPLVSGTPTPEPAPATPVAAVAESPTPKPTEPVATTTAIAPAVEHPAAALAPHPRIDLHALMAQAMDKGAEGVQMLERLVSLNQQIEAKAARDAFFEALRAFQAECPSIKKNRSSDKAGREGNAYVYHYADFDQIVSTVRPLLDKHGLSFSFDMETTDGKIVTSCIVRHKAGHFEISKFTCPTTGSNPKVNAQQQMGGSYTFSRRYALVGALGLATTEDDTDGKDAPPELQGPISEEEGHKLLAAIDSLGDNYGENRMKFCRAFRVETVYDLPKSRLQEATDAVEAKRKRGGGR